jgi:dUTP pyrophosphatase
MDPFFSLGGAVAAYANVVAVRPLPQAFEVELANGTRIASEPLAVGQVEARMAGFVSEWRARTADATGAADRPTLEVLKLNPAAVLPVRGSTGASCFDLCAIDAGTLQPGEWRVIKTGLSMAVPVGFEIQVRSRSGLAAKRGVFVLNSPGTVDSDYRGEVGVILANLGTAPFEYAAGDRIAQAAVCPVVMSTLVEVQQLSGTQRGAGGFGSTGVAGAVPGRVAG